MVLVVGVNKNKRRILAQTAFFCFFHRFYVRLFSNVGVSASCHCMDEGATRYDLKRLEFHNLQSQIPYSFVQIFLALPGNPILFETRQVLFFG